MRDPDATFALLSAILRKHAGGMFVKVDDAANLYVEVAKAARGAKPRFFGAVQLKKAYVGIHLMPLYENPALLNDVSAALRRRMQGKSCFNVKTIEPDLLDELDSLIARCAAFARSPGVRTG